MTGGNNHRVTAKLEILSWNIRSLPKNKEAVAAVLEIERPDVLALQETWLKGPPPNLHQDYDRVSSLPKKNEGVAMYTRKGLRFRSALDQEWSSNILVMTSGKLAIVTVYVNQGWRQQILSDLERVVNRLRSEDY